MSGTVVDCLRCRVATCDGATLLDALPRRGVRPGATLGDLGTLFLDEPGCVRCSRRVLDSPIC